MTDPIDWKARAESAESALRLSVAREAVLVEALTRVAVVKHVRPAENFTYVDNGYSCRVCTAECGREEELTHAPTCPLASPSTAAAEMLKRLADVERGQFAWLIEAAESPVSHPLYWRGSFGDERDHWTDDHLKAVRLARKEDAEAVATGVLSGYAVRIAEHGWS